MTNAITASELPKVRSLNYGSVKNEKSTNPKYVRRWVVSSSMEGANPDKANAYQELISSDMQPTVSTQEQEQAPVRWDENRRLRVADTRVLLDLVVYAFQRGKSPVAIVASYPSLNLRQVNGAITYYLVHQIEVDAYLRDMEAEAEAFQRNYQANNPPKVTREILLARLAAKRDTSDQ
ncbi:MAG TPA: DUF433 domain-containing protein [Aggregatilineales bacterium]|nr:DUF433 domain-containing protein [Aggregatilineales bacterium]